MNTFTASQKKIDGPKPLSTTAVLLIVGLIVAFSFGYVLKVLNVVDDGLQTSCEVKRIPGDKHHPFHKVCK